jgi:tetratricopeptide (TPR) repeat protein
MEREIWSRDDLARVVQREAVPVRVEVDRANNVGVAVGDRYGIQALPQVLFLEPQKGGVVERLEGTQTAEKILATLDLAQAKAFSSEQLQAAGEDSSALVRLAGRLVRAQKIEDARRALDKAWAFDNACAKDDADDAALLLADLDERRQEQARALSRLEDAIERCPRSSGAPEIWKRLRDLAPRAGGAAAEERVLRLQAGAQPNDPEVLRALSSFLLSHAGDLAEAERLAARAVDVAPEDPPSLCGFAEVRLRQKRFDDAQALVDRAIAIDPHDPASRELRLRIFRARSQQNP